MTKLLALTQGLCWGDGQSHDHTHSQYAFVTAHIHVSLYRERGLVMSGRKDLKSKEAILVLLEVI